MWRRGCYFCNIYFNANNLNQVVLLVSTICIFNENIKKDLCARCVQSVDGEKTGTAESEQGVYCGVQPLRFTLMKSFECSSVSLVLNFDLITFILK